MDDEINVLLVDDEPRNLQALDAILEGGRYRLLFAGTADVALRLLLEHEINAIVLDIQMPHVDGIELAQIIKGSRRFRDIPILFLSAHLVEDADIVAGYEAGATDYLTKPFNPTILRHKLASAVDLFRKTRNLAELNESLEKRVQARTAELERSDLALREAARQKDEFLAMLAHELRNPLAPIRTGLDLLLKKQPSPGEKDLRTLAVIDRQVDQMVHLIDDLLDVSRLDRGVLELKNSEVDLAQLIESCVETFRPVFAKRGISSDVAAASGIYAVVDPTRIAQIVGNLLHNASKFTEPGGWVRIELDRDATGAIVRVIDNGAGIAPSQLGNVFSMFARIEGPSGRVAQDSGIGLALARRLAILHGGTLDVASDGEGRGTTFTLRLPAQARNVPVSAEVALAPSPSRREMRPLDIVVIEDNEDVADTLVMWLEERGHRVRLARTGTDGVAEVLSSRPRLVLCDLGLPDLDGCEVCRRVREQTTDYRPIMIALTGWGSQDDRSRTRDAGFDHHLVKPVPLDVLFTLLEEAAAREG